MITVCKKMFNQKAIGGIDKVIEIVFAYCIIWYLCGMTGRKTMPDLNVDEVAALLKKMLSIVLEQEAYHLQCDQ